MKTLNNYLVLYDEECPMCRMYTKAFVKAGMLDDNGRAAYQNAPQEICPLVDMQRAVNEIALVNKETGEVSYGVESLFKIIGQSWPVFKPLFSFAPFVWLMRKLYAFISYNRRVIIPAESETNTFAFQPTFRKDYRVIYLLLTWFVSAYILSRYTPLFTPILSPGRWYREYVLCGGQILFQAMIATIYFRSKVWEYLGNMMTISLAGALLVLPVLIISHWFHLPPLFYLLYFITVTVLMLLDHIRRSKLLDIGWLLTISWILYRMLLLLLILQVKY